MLLVFSLCCIMMIQDCSIGLWLSPWGWWWIEQVFLFQRITLIVQVKNHFVFICIWIEFPHQPTDCNCTERVGRQPTELPFFSFMAEWEKERGQWFQRALVGSQFYPSHWIAMLPFHIHVFFSSGQNSRIVPWGRWQLHGLQEDRGWREEVLRIKYNWLWCSLMEGCDKPKPDHMI